MSFVGTRPRSSSPSLPQPAAATAAPEVATILKNARRSIPFWAGPLMPLSACRPSRVVVAGVAVRSEGRRPEARAERNSGEARAEKTQRAHPPLTLMRSLRLIRCRACDALRDGRWTNLSGLRPCEPYHAEKPWSIVILLI